MSIYNGGAESSILYMQKHDLMLEQVAFLLKFIHCIAIVLTVHQSIAEAVLDGCICLDCLNDQCLRSDDSGGFVSSPV